MQYGCSTCKHEDEPVNGQQCRPCRGGDQVGTHWRPKDSLPVPVALDTTTRMRNHQTAIERLSQLAVYMEQHAESSVLNVAECAARIRDYVGLLRS